MCDNFVCVSNSNLSKDIISTYTTGKNGNAVVYIPKGYNKAIISDISKMAVGYGLSNKSIQNTIPIGSSRTIDVTNVEYLYLSSYLPASETPSIFTLTLSV